MKINVARILAVVIAALGLAACTVGPSYPGGAAPVVDRTVLEQTQPVPMAIEQAPPQPVFVPQQAPIEVTTIERQAPIISEPSPEEIRVIEEPTPPPSPVPPPSEPEGNQAVVALLDSAATHVGDGELDKAAAALERALRIEPRNASIWHDLGQIRLHQGKFTQAESMASKSNSLASNNSALKARNYRLISVARRASGNGEGADAAEAQANLLEN